MPKIDFFKKQKAKKTGNSGFEGKSINLASCKKRKKEKEISMELNFYKKHECMNTNGTLPPWSQVLRKATAKISSLGLN